MSRLGWLTWLTAAILAGASPAPPADPRREPAQAPAPEMTPAAERAVERGLAFLAGQQQDNGAFGSGPYGQNVAVTSLAGMAFLSGGHVPGRGAYGVHVERALDFVLKSTSPSGFVAAQTSHGPMYCHGFGTLFLAETYGMTGRPDLREKLRKAVQLIVATQNAEGGWRYQPVPQDADLSVTICQIMALRAARNAGIYVPKSVVDKCVQYVRKSQNPDGGFRYMLYGGPSAFPRSAAGVVALYSAGIYEGPEIDKGLQYLMTFLPRGRAADARRAEGEAYGHYFYGHYYAVQAMFQAGEPYWSKWFPAIRDELIARQQRDGCWYDSVSREYGTAMACLILQVPNRYLPIFQR